MVVPLKIEDTHINLNIRFSLKSIHLRKILPNPLSSSLSPYDLWFFPNVLTLYLRQPQSNVVHLRPHIFLESCVNAQARIEFYLLPSQIRISLSTIGSGRWQRRKRQFLSENLITMTYKDIGEPRTRSQSENRKLKETASFVSYLLVFWLCRVIPVRIW